MAKKRYNHAFTIAFSATSNHPKADDMTEMDYAVAILKRVATLIEDHEMIEAVGMPFDTYEEPSNQEGSLR